jgi:hypothetical protein
VIIIGKSFFLLSACAGSLYSGWFPIVFVTVFMISLAGNAYSIAADLNG